MANHSGPFRMDAAGFRRRVAWRGPFGGLSELISNALDEKITTCTVVFQKVRGDLYSVIVEDDCPTGFRKLSDTYMAMADSYKMDDPSQRGRFNWGEKVSIVLCTQYGDVTISSTTGTIVFPKGDKDYEDYPRRKRFCGSRFEGMMRMTPEKYEETIAKLKRIIVPEGKTVLLNGEPLPTRTPFKSIQVTLPTIVQSKKPEDEEALIKVERMTTVNLYKVAPGEKPTIYELGIPVVSYDDDLYHADVMQKVPLGLDRNSVPDKFHNRLNAAIIDDCSALLTSEEAAKPSVERAIPYVEDDEAVKTVATTLFGENRFVPDPNNREATGELTAKGWTAVAGGSFSGEAWGRIRRAGAIKSGSHFIPKPEGQSFVRAEETEGMKRFRAFNQMVARITLNKSCFVEFCDNPKITVPAQCGPCDGGFRVTYHVNVLGTKWFDRAPASTPEMLDLMLHEFGHHSGDQDCTRAFVDQVTKTAAAYAVMVLKTPEFVADYR